jgi:hypothetical protein
MDRTIAITGISDELLSRLDERAGQVGVDRDAYVRRLIERAVAPPDAWSPLGDLLAPVHDYTEAHGISETDVERLFRNQIVEKRAKNRKADDGGRPVR